MFGKIIAFVVLLLAVQLYILVPRYPDGHENVTVKRLVAGAMFGGFFRATLLAERMGIIEDSAVFMQNIFSASVKEHEETEHVGIEKVEIAGHPVTIFRPAKTATNNKAKAIVYFHGGGFVLGSVHSHFRWTQSLANESGVVFLSVEYPLGPKHPFPTAIDSCIEVTKAIFKQAKELKIDPTNISVAGDSAGGNLAAVVALELAGSKEFPLKAQILLVPVVLSSGVSMLPSYAHYHSIFRSNFSNQSLTRFF